MKCENPDSKCLVVEMRCECGRTLYLAASREAPCRLAFGATPDAAAAALTRIETQPREERDED